MSHSFQSRPLPQEIIEIIFSYLSQSTLRCCARLVCKEWNLICLKYALWRAAVWSADLSKERADRLLKQLRRLDSLAIWIQCDPTLTDHKLLTFTTEEQEQEHIIAFETFRKGILEQLDQFQLQHSGGRGDGTHFASLTDRRRVLRRHPFGNLKELSFHGYGIQHDLHLGPLLPAMTHLQRLKLEIWDRQDIFLMRLLRACPVLEDLEIFGRQEEGLRIWVLEDDEEERSPARTPLSHHPLKRLYLRRVTIRQRSIERIIPVLTELIAFRIVEFNRPWRIEPADFHCESVEFYTIEKLIQLHMFPPEKSGKIEAFLLETYHEDAAFGQYLCSAEYNYRWLPNLRVLYFVTAPLEDYWFRFGWHSTSQTIETVEIIGQGRHFIENSVVGSPSIEGYLRRNQHLKHLKAPESVIRTRGIVDMYMSDPFKKAVKDRDSALALRVVEKAAKAAAAELEAIRLTSGTAEDDKCNKSRHRSKKLDPLPITLEPIRLNCDYIWVCEGLLTLKLGLVTDPRVTPKSAAEFAAAASRPHVMTENEQLARAYAYIATVCPNLRTVEFYHTTMQFGGEWVIAHGGDVSKLDEEDQSHPLKQLTRLKDLETLTLRLHTIEGHIEFEDFEWMMETVAEEGSPSGASKVACWPKLESFQIRYNTSAKNENYQYWMALVRELRPGLDVRVKQDLLIPWCHYRR
ncbi:hypothetical protein EMPS_06888 [Entomortierella parvispora]|uniref:F-box domain-containing protein n=1 Tax=Entomortierella parvispora TaxID=205924 RepID=A0A9P3LY60_9FUNG|nr:hypothetical protein EMPS_06888 [Entomortierella parvispora]